MFENMPDWLTWDLVRFLCMLLKGLWSWRRRYVAKRKAEQKRKDEQSPDPDKQS